MGKKLLWVALALLLVGAGTYSFMHFFKGSTKHLKLVPSDATVVVKIDFKSLAKKMDYDGKFKTTKLYKKIQKEASKSKDTFSSLFGDLLKDPMSTGLNVFSNTFMFQKRIDKQDYFGFVVDIRDMDNFNRTVLKFPGAKEKIKKSDDFFFMKSSDFSILAWNEKGLLFLTVDRGWMYNEEESDGIEVIAKDIMMQNESNNITSNKEFMEFSKNNHDLSFFINYSKLLSTFSVINEVSISKGKNIKDFNELLKGVYFNGGLDFEDDRIVFDGELTGDKKKLESVNYLRENGISEDALYALTNDKLLMMISANINPEKFVSYMVMILGEDMDTYKKLDEIGSGAGLTGKDIIKAIGGELTVALVDFDIKKKMKMDYTINEATGQYEMKLVEGKVVFPKLTLSVSIKDKAVIDKLMAMTPYPLANDMSIIPIPMIDSQYVYLVSKKNRLFVSTDQNLGMMMQSNGKLSKKPADEITKLAKDNSTSMFFDMDTKKYKSLLEYFETIGGVKNVKYFKDYMSIFKNVKGSNKGYKSNVTIEMNKGEGNSLYRIIKQYDVLPIESL